MESGIRKRKGNHGNGNGIRNTESNITDRKLKNFTLHNLVQSKENLFWYIFLLMCLDKVCRSVGYCTARPMKVIFTINFYSRVYRFDNTVKYCFCS